MPSAAAPSSAPSPFRAWLGLFLRNPSGVAGSLLLLAVILISAFGPALYGTDPFAVTGRPFSPPGPRFWLGTDNIGRDLMAGVLVGGRVTLAVGALSAVVSIVIGIGVGALSASCNRVVAAVAMKLTEFFQVLPALLFAMVIVTLFGVGLWTIALAIGVVSWTSVGRLTRAEVLRIRELSFVQASRTAGATDLGILLRVILPNALPSITVASALAIGTAILFESGLSFLGLGDPNRMSWGFIIGANRDYFLISIWGVVGPGTAIFLSVLAISLLGDGLNDTLNPKFRER